MSCECVHTKSETGTSVLEIRMDDVCTKTIKMICEEIEEWIYMYIHGMSEAECEHRCSSYRTKCVEEDKMCNKSREEIVLGYKPCETCKPVSTYVENPDGTSKFTITLDATSTECFPNLETHMKDLLCHRSEIEVKRILEELMASGSIDETKTKREIIMEYQHEKNPEPEFEDIPFVDQTAVDLQTTDTNLQTTKEELQTTKEELQSEKNKVATMELLVASLVKACRGSRKSSDLKKKRFRKVQNVLHRHSQAHRYHPHSI